MTQARVIDTTLRDGNQSLWGARGVTTQLVEDVAPLIDRVGFEVCEFITSTIMAMAIKHQREDPWERIRVARHLMPHTPLGFLTTGKRFITWQRTPDSLLEMAYELLARNGISRFWVCDPMVNGEGARENARVAKRVGAEEVVVGLVFSISPIHTDRFYAEAAAAIDDCDDIDAVYLKDPGGLLTPERLTTLVPAIRSGLRTKPLVEIHSHCNTGVSPRTVLDAVDLGIGTVHCAVGVASNGTSHPSARQFARNLTTRGHHADLDLDALGELEDRLAEHVAANGLPVGQPLEYDETYYRHQLPGGMVSTTLRQLTEIGREDLLPEVKEEVVRVREDFGYPIMVTPFSQFMATQALLNVLGEERYATISDETALYVLGDFGAPQGDLEPQLVDRVEAVVSERSLTLEREEPTRPELRQRYGTEMSDEDLLMSALISPDEVAAMRAAPARSPAPAPAWTRPIARLFEELAERPSLRAFSLATADITVDVRRDG